MTINVARCVYRYRSCEIFNRALKIAVQHVAVFTAHVAFFATAILLGWQTVVVTIAQNLPNPTRISDRCPPSVSMITRA